MGQKTHPRGFRLGVIETWDSKWYHEDNYADWLHEDLKVQNYVKEQLYHAGISKIEIERYTDKCTVRIHTARPGIVIGRGGSQVESLQEELSNLINKEVRIVVEEIRNPELDAQLVAESVALQIERRTNYKQAMKKAIAAAVKGGAEGVKVRVAGRLGGHEIARDEKQIEGRVPLHTLRAEIDYGFAEAHTKAGKIGVKVWIFKGEIIPTAGEEEEEKEAERETRPSRERQPRRESGRRKTSRDRRDRKSGSRRDNRRGRSGRRSRSSSKSRG